MENGNWIIQPLLIITLKDNDNNKIKFLKLPTSYVGIALNGDSLFLSLFKKKKLDSPFTCIYHNLNFRPRF